jgi:hypothetical protein
MARPRSTTNSGPDLAAFAARIERIAAALDRLAPPAAAAPRFAAADAFVWHPDGCRLDPVKRVNRVDMSLLKGIDRVRDLLVENTERFARGLPANNALLWGARGMGKSSLVKAAHAAVNATHAGDGAPLKLIEIHREEIESLPELMGVLRAAKERFIVFCDDLSFDANDTSYKSLKAVLEGGIEGRPDTFLSIPDNYYDDLDSRQELDPDLLRLMKENMILYDRDSEGEFFQVYTHAFDERFFFEVVERRGYKGFGAPNAGIRLAAQTREARPRTMPRS